MLFIFICLHRVYFVLDLADLFSSCKLEFLHFTAAFLNTKLSLHHVFPSYLERNAFGLFYKNSDKKLEA